jgi:hypothetical protein
MQNKIVLTLLFTVVCISATLNSRAGFANFGNRANSHNRQETVADTVAPTTESPTNPPKYISNPASTAAKLINGFNATDYVFDLFGSLSTENGSGGNLGRFNVESVPALQTHRIALTLIRLLPCGINTAHVHPRASQAIFNINGTNVRVGFAAENGANYIQNDVRSGFSTFIPQGAVHFEQNLDCEIAFLIAANNHEDPGTLSIGTSFFQDLPGDLVAPTLGIDEALVADIAAAGPASNAPLAGAAACRARCGLSK